LVDIVFIAACLKLPGLITSRYILCAEILSSTVTVHLYPVFLTMAYDFVYFWFFVPVGRENIGSFCLESVCDIVTMD
jgi:hypothetical protein